MNNLHEFLQFNNTCPVCHNPLTLYLQWINSVCFKATKVNSNQYKLEQFKSKHPDLGDIDYVTLLERNNLIETRFNTTKVANEAKKHQMYFFFLCNSSGFKDIYGSDYEINIHEGCYFRSTPFYEYKRSGIGHPWQLETSNKDYENIVNSDETFCFRKNIQETERVYVLALDYTESKTVLMHYSVTPEQREDKNFEPNIFDKTIPLLGARPNFEIDNRDKLIDKFDNWILVS